MGTDKTLKDAVSYAMAHHQFFHSEVAGMRVALRIENQILDVKMTKQQEDEILYAQVAKRYLRNA